MLTAALIAAVTCGTAASRATADTGSGLPALPNLKVGVKLTSGAHLAPGLIFIDPHQVVDSIVTGPMIITDTGRVVWYHPLPAGESASNFQVQRYRGHPVLTWWQGTGDNPAFGAFAPGIGQGEDVIMNDHYRIIKVLSGDSSFTPDTHEFYLTPQGDALMTGYHEVPHIDLTGVGGSSDGTVIDSVAREVDVSTGKVRMDWSALAHVPLTDSHALPLLGTSPWDFFHINSISPAPGGNLLISSRHMWALYDVNPHTGHINWTLGGAQSSFSLGSGAQFAWQHQPRFVSPDEIQLFDDQSGTPFPANQPRSRALWLHLDYADHTATVVKQIDQPAGQPETGSQGSVQTLPDGHVLVGWGSAGTLSEYDRRGRLLLDDTLPAVTRTVTLPNGQKIPNSWSTYRVFKQTWTGRPATVPAISVHATAGHTLQVSAAWNGATRLARWLVLGGPTRHDLHPIATHAWHGLITTFSAPARHASYVQVVALSKTGRHLRASRRVHVTF